MTREEVKSIVDKIQVYRQTFLITNNVYQEWNRILEPYDYDDVNNKLNEFFKNGDNFGRYPDAYQLTKHLMKATEKSKNKGMKIACKNCNRFLSIEEYDTHFDKCNSINYLKRNYKKYYGKVLSSKELWALSNEKFWELYWKFNEQIVSKIQKGDEKETLMKAIEEHKKYSEGKF